jgi:hypothetical protein
MKNSVLSLEELKEKAFQLKLEGNFRESARYFIGLAEKCLKNHDYEGAIFGYLNAGECVELYEDENWKLPFELAIKTYLLVCKEELAKAIKLRKGKVLDYLFHFSKAAAYLRHSAEISMKLGREKFTNQLVHTATNITHVTVHEIGSLITMFETKSEVGEKKVISVKEVPSKFKTDVKVSKKRKSPVKKIIKREDRAREDKGPKPRRIPVVKLSEVSDHINCAMCGVPNPPEVNFCRVCGSRLEKICSVCKKKIYDLKLKNCPVCGTTF